MSRPARTLVLAALLGLLGAMTGSCSKSSSDAAVPADCTKVTGTAVTLIAKNVAWRPTCLDVRRGAVNFTIDNQDKSVAHNLRVKGQGVDEHTKLKLGPLVQRLSVDLKKPGRYTYVCDIHANMKGTLIAG